MRGSREEVGCQIAGMDKGRAHRHSGQPGVCTRVGRASPLSWEMGCGREGSASHQRARGRRRQPRPCWRPRVALAPKPADMQSWRPAWRSWVGRASSPAPAGSCRLQPCSKTTDRGGPAAPTPPRWRCPGQRLSWRVARHGSLHGGRGEGGCWLLPGGPGLGPPASTAPIRQRIRRALADVCRHAEGLSGRSLRKLPFLAHASRGLACGCPAAQFIDALGAALASEGADRETLLAG